MTTGYIDLPITVSLSSTLTTTLYVDGTRIDSYTQDGSFITPFKTIQAAVNQIVINGDNSSKVYEIDILGATVYTETVSLNDISLYSVIFKGGPGVTIDGGSGPSFTSTTNNNHVGATFYGLRFTKDVIFHGQNNTRPGLGFFDCYFSGATYDFSCINQLYFKHCWFNFQTGSPSITFTNVPVCYFVDGQGIDQDFPMSVLGNPGGPIPSGQSAGSTLYADSVPIFGNLTIDVYSLLLAFDGSMIGFTGSTFSNAGTAYLVNAAVLADMTLANGSTLYMFGSSLCGTITDNGATTQYFDNEDLVTTNALRVGGAAVATNAKAIVKNGHFKSTQTTAPTVAVSANAGTGASATLTLATDTAGIVELVLGTLALGSGAQATVTFNKAYNVAPIVVLFPNNAAAASNVAAFGIYATSNTTTFSINFGTAGVALTDLKFNYLVMETQ